MIAALLACAALAACKNAGFRSASDDAKAKSFAVAPGKSTIYLVRPDTVHKLPLAVMLDDKLTTRTGPCSYLVWQVDPGAHQILAHGENISQLALAAEAGKTYFVRQDVAGGLWSPRTLLTLIDEQTGRKAVLACGLIDSGSQNK